MGVWDRKRKGATGGMAAMSQDNSIDTLVSTEDEKNMNTSKME